MHRFARAFVSVLLLGAAALAGCAGGASDGTFNSEQFWKKQQKEGN